MKVDLTLNINRFKPLMMQNRLALFIFFSLIFSLCFVACKKHKHQTPVDQLPPATETGANTFGFLLNGQPWTPKGWNGSTSNLSVSVDDSYKNGTFNITAYKISGDSDKEYLALGLADSLNFQSIPATLQLRKPLFGLVYTNGSCIYDGFFDTLTYASGQLNISKFDKNNRIISGTFFATLFKPNCGDTIKITEGRFDMKF
jgi:hypothetical protein